MDYLTAPTPTGYGAGGLAGAGEHAQLALATLPAEADAIRCAVAFSLGMLHEDGGKHEPARQAFTKAFEAARRSGANAYVAVSALSQLGGIASLQGKLREAEGLFRRAVRCGQDRSLSPMAQPRDDCGLSPYGRRGMIRAGCG